MLLLTALQQWVGVTVTPIMLPFVLLAVQVCGGNPGFLGLAADAFADPSNDAEWDAGVHVRLA